MRNKFLSHEYRVLSSAKLHISDFSIKKNISFMNILNCSGPNIDPSGNIKLIFLPKCTTSRLQPLDAGIIKAFKRKHRKRLLKYVVSQIDEGKNVSEIILGINIANAIHWLQLAWRDVSTETIINCFQKCLFEQ